MAPPTRKVPPLGEASAVVKVAIGLVKAATAPVPSTSGQP
jgi:hypothetical protein